MKYSIVYKSKTGNTKQLAQVIKDHTKNVVYYGEPHKEATQADFIFVGSWTDKGTCDEEIASFLKCLQGKKVFLFGSAGFGGGEEYFSKIIRNIKKNIGESNEVAGIYMCQGRMPQTVRERYVAMAETQPEKMAPMIQNFDQALTHPNEDDLTNLLDTIKKVIPQEEFLANESL